MTSTVFQDYNENNPIVSSWLNDVNNAVYGNGQGAVKALQIAAAWVRFSISGGVVTIKQSEGIASVVRTSQGQYQITYSQNMQGIANCYQFSQSSPGFMYASNEAVNGVQINVTNVTGILTDPGEVGFVLYGQLG